jgi:3-dehydroquinate dehydratase/shikimate dehydrogenase
MTYLCVPIFVRDAEQTRRDVALAAEAGAEMVELRIDHLGNKDELTDTIAEQIAGILAASTLPAIVTCRPTWEGGYSELPDGARLRFLRTASDQGAAYVDIELKSYKPHDRGSDLDEVDLMFQEDRPQRSGRIVSAHDFTTRPARLMSIVNELNGTEADVAKIVWMARSIRDNIEAFEILLNRGKPTIALCMGEAGLISRVLARKFGAFLTFASLDQDSGTAPGQVSIHDMKRVYRWDAIKPTTRVYGVVASPVAHSMSPAIHNAAFEQVGEDGVYLPMLVQPGYESFKAFMEEFTNFKPLHLRGLSVTLPHKENALKYLQEKGATIDPLAVAIGAVNTIIIDRDADENPILRGMNSDYQAIIDTICAAKGIQQAQLADYRVAVIGAGGTGRTAVAALANLGATVVVYNRTRDRAEALAAEFNGKRGKVVSAAMEKLCDSCCQIYINTTSVGMHPNVDQSPLGDKPPKFSSESLVFDAVYNPPITRLLADAAAAGAQTVGGIDMFVRQAAAQFQAWTGKSAPADLMRRIIEHKRAR